MHNVGPVNRAVALILALCFLALGSGLVRSWHDAVHAHEDACHHAASAVDGLPAEHDDHHPQHHDETNCFTHAQLSQGLAVVAWVPLLVCLGLFVAFLTLLDSLPVPNEFVSGLACRGPPTC